ncbi:MAG TPA: hypothetical protein V6D14_13165 [Coleofasciculaceae cyanobacterium]
MKKNVLAITLPISRALANLCLPVLAFDLLSHEQAATTPKDYGSAHCGYIPKKDTLASVKYIKIYTRVTTNSPASQTAR